MQTPQHPPPKVIHEFYIACPTLLAVMPCHHGPGGPVALILPRLLFWQEGRYFFFYKGKSPLILPITAKWVQPCRSVDAKCCCALKWRRYTTISCNSNAGTDGWGAVLPPTPSVKVLEESTLRFRKVLLVACLLEKLDESGRN